MLTQEDRDFYHKCAPDLKDVGYTTDFSFDRDQPAVPTLKFFDKNDQDAADALASELRQRCGLAQLQIEDMSDSTDKGGSGKGQLEVWLGHGSPDAPG